MTMPIGPCDSSTVRYSNNSNVIASSTANPPIVPPGNKVRFVPSIQLNEPRPSLFKKIATGFGIAASAVLSAMLVLKGKSAKAMKYLKLTPFAMVGMKTGKSVKKNAISPFIKFKPARSVKEAKFFGKKFLGVESYKGIDNLELLNYVNEGLLDATKATKGKAVMPTVVEGTSKSDAFLNSPMSAVTKKNGERILEINKKFFKKAVDNNLKKTYKEMLKKGYITKKGGKYFLALRARCGQKALVAEKTINKLFKSNKKLSIKEKMSLSRLCDNMTSFSANNIRTNNPMAGIRNICDGMGKDNFVLNGINYRLADVERMDIRTQGALLEAMLQNGMKYDFTQKATCYVTHEVGHLHHANNVGYKQYYEMAKIDCPSVKQASTWNKQGVSLLQGSINQQLFKNDPLKQSIAAEVSERAMESPLEFVSEVYSKLLEKKTFSPRVMNMFKEYGGTIAA